VEGEAQGGDREMGKLLKDIEKGPRGASVKQVELEDRDLVGGETAFEVRR
jgi:acylphosphatase